MANALYVLIPTHGRPTLLGRTLASLAACRLPEPYRKTVVVENGAQTGAEAVVAAASAAHPALRLRYLHVARANKSHALNEALKTVADSLVVFFDDDVWVEPGTLEAYAEVARGRHGGAFFGGPVGVNYEEAPPAWLVSALPFSARGYNLRAGERPGIYLGFNWAAFAEDLIAVGGFDVRLGPGSAVSLGEESELQSRLVDAGVQPVDALQAWVTHFVPRERCSRWWVAQRERSHGLSASRVALARGSKRPPLIKRAVRGIGQGVADAIKPSILRDEAERWRAVFKVSYHWGLLCAAVIRLEET